MNTALGDGGKVSRGRNSTTAGDVDSPFTRILQGEFSWGSGTQPTIVRFISRMAARID
jgi:hypothetical protein